MKFEDVFNLIIPASFGAYEDNDETTVMEEVYNQLNNSVRTAYGASQFVIIFDDADEVVKIPFEGEWFYCDDNEDEAFDAFSTDYSQLSVDVYNKAVDAGLTPLFAETRFLGYSANHYPLYAQKKVAASFAETELEKDKIYKIPSKETIEMIRSNCYNTTSYAWRAFAIDWVGCAVETYGFEMVSDMMDFLDENGIDDLHRNNYGFDAEGRPIIFDYCGFDY